MSTIKTKIILRRGVSWQLPGHPRSYGRGDVTQLETGENGISDIFFADDTDSLILEPITTHADFTKPLDTGELAFTTDEGRLFIGSDNERGLPQRYRVKYPYQNTEIVAENSTKAFADLHGHRLKNGNGADYFGAPMFLTDRPPSTTLPKFLIENMAGYETLGVSTNDYPTTGVGTPPTRVVSASSALFLSTHPSSSRTVKIAAVDQSINRYASLVTTTAGSVSSFTVEVKDFDNNTVYTFPVTQTANVPDFTVSSFLANGGIVGQRRTSAKNGVTVYKTDGTKVDLKIITHGTYDAALDRTRITETYYAPGKYSQGLGMVLVEGVPYVNLGENFSIGTAGDYIVVSCTTVVGEATDPSCFIVLTKDGAFVSKLNLPPHYVGMAVTRWSKVGDAAMAEIRPLSSPAKIHGILIKVALNVATLEWLPLHDYGQNTVSKYGSPTLDHYFYDSSDNSMVLFMAAKAVGEKGYYYAVVKWSLTTKAALWTSQTSILITDGTLPGLSNRTWRAPKSIILADVATQTYKWLTEIGVHEINLTTGAIKCAAWVETNLAKPIFVTDVMFYNKPSDELFFGGIGQDALTYRVINNSTESSGDLRYTEYADGYIYGGNEREAVFTTLTSSNGFHEYLVSVSRNSVALYRASDYKFVTGWDGGKTAFCGGAAIPCSNGVTLVPLTHGAVLRITVTDVAMVSFAIIPVISGTEEFGKKGIYFHDIADNSLVVLGGPTNGTTSRSFKWSISNRTFIWNRSFSNPLDADDIDGGCPTASISSGRMLKSGLYAFMNKQGGLSLIRLSTGERLLSTVVPAPWGDCQWEWESATNTLYYLNTRQNFSANSDSPIKDQLAGFIGDEPYLSGAYRHVELFAIRFTNTSGGWSATIGQSAPSSDPFPPENRLWIDYQARHAYFESNGKIKCYNIDTLEPVMEIETATGQGLVKLSGSSVLNKLYIQYGGHGGYNGDNGAYDDPAVYEPLTRTERLFAPVNAITLVPKEEASVDAIYWKTVYKNGQEATPVEFDDIKSSTMFIDYMVNTQSGQPVRHGRMEVQYFHNPFANPGEPAGDAKPSLIDEAECVRNPDVKIFDAERALGDIGFRFVLHGSQSSPKLLLQYRNTTGQKLWISWKLTRP